MESLARFDFVKAYMIVSMATFVWFGLSFPAAGRRGSRVAARMLVAGLVAYLAAVLTITVWAIVSGQWARFSVTLGVGVLFEMAVFVAIWQFIMYFMASRRVSDKRKEELGRA